MNRRLVILILGVAVAFYCCMTITSRWLVDSLLMWIVGATTIVATIALFETLLSFRIVDHFNLPFLSPTEIAGIGTNSSANDRGDVIRAQATTAHPIELGVISATVLPLAAHLFLSERQRSRRIALLIAASCIAAAAILSVSRSAIVSVAAAAAIFVVAAPRHVRRILIRVGLPIAIVIGFAFWPAARQIISSFTYASTDYSIIYRTIDYPLVLDELAASPLLGSGPGTWIPPVHNIFDNSYLLTVVEQGMAGLVALLAVIGVSLWLTLKGGAQTARARVQGVSVAASLGSLAFAGATFDLTAFDISYGLLMLLVGSAGAIGRLTQRESGSGDKLQ